MCDPTASPQPPAEEPSTPEPTLNRRRSESGARSGSKRRRSEMGARSGSKRRRNKSTVRPSRRSSPSQRVSAEAREVKPSRGQVVNRDNESRDSASRDASTRSASTRLDSIDSDDTVSESSTSRARAKKPDRACQVRSMEQRTYTRVCVCVECRLYLCIYQVISMYWICAGRFGVYTMAQFVLLWRRLLSVFIFV